MKRIKKTTWSCHQQNHQSTNVPIYSSFCSFVKDALSLPLSKLNSSICPLSSEAYPLLPAWELCFGNNLPFSHIMGFSVSSQSFISGYKHTPLPVLRKLPWTYGSHPAIVSFLCFSLQQNAQWDVSVLTFFTFHSLILLKTVLVRVNKNHHLSKSTAWPVIPFETIKCFILPRGFIEI